MEMLINLQKQNGQPVVSSREVAEHFGKRHDNVVRDIENLIEGMSKIEDTHKLTKLFLENVYRNEQNQQMYKEYLLNRDGFTLLAMGFTGSKALEWKIKYIDAFNQMEQFIKSGISAEYLNGFANIVKTIARVMKAQGSSPYKIAQQTALLCQMYNVPLVDRFIEPTYEQISMSSVNLCAQK